MNMIGKKVKMKIETCFLCNGTGKVTQQKGYKYKQVNCNHIYDYNTAISFLNTARQNLEIAKQEERKYQKAITAAEII